MSNTWGDRVKLSIFGESHGPGIGIVIGGLPPGLALDWHLIKTQMARRAPGKSTLSTPRLEGDEVEILSGLFQGKTTGAPLCALIRNRNTKSEDYSPQKLRPGHADFTAMIKYKGFTDPRGGGHFSGRLTAPLVFAGSIARQILQERGIDIGARILQIFDVCDASCSPEEVIEASHKRFATVDDDCAEKMKKTIENAKADGDSVGGVVECVAIGLPPAWGDPFFGSLESRISSMMFSIPAVKGIEFGAGFALAGMRGSEANDPFCLENGEIRTLSNNAGGILGGISNGQPIVFRLAVKPTPTIFKEQTTVDIQKNETVRHAFVGRHDPCILPRVLPVVEAGLALCLLDCEEHER